MRAVWNNQVIAEASKEELIRIEGNWYFPPTSVNAEYIAPSTHRTMCFWKGDAAYYDVHVDGSTNENAAWYYPSPMKSGVARVGKDFTNYVAFWHGVEVQE